MLNMTNVIIVLRGDTTEKIHHTRPDEVIRVVFFRHGYKFIISFPPLDKNGKNI